MGWERGQYVKALRRPRHARVRFCTVACCDCGRSLQATHLVERFGERCRSCCERFWSAAAAMASQYEAGEGAEER